jgi:hypothetical protein
VCVCVRVCARVYGQHSEEGKFDGIKGYSPRYAPPEVFARVHLRNTSNSVEDDKMSDVYSMGVVLWETTARQVRSQARMTNMACGHMLWQTGRGG